MSEVHVAYGDSQADTATLLLAAVEEIEGVEPGSVRIDTGTGSFVVPEEVAKKAGLDSYDPAAELNAAVEEARKTAELPSQSVTQDEAEQKAMAEASDSPAEDAPKPAKKTAAKKTTARKTAAKKTAKKGS